MMLSEYSFPALLEDRERRLDRDAEIERRRRERAPRRPARRLPVLLRLLSRTVHARA
ncbi:hypothetical protein [Rathayibacter sp. VKM Ac-2754]|uniref:hypothetical protein n=1 Tax=Rathayibacter sp. VKM Ac-2754 TaxID=2609251 RepID=UPI00135A4C75|nr:hypothetical protein [Rathayibacter sp. VKM Ac-2754]MWV59133.1 hypothetical protein [Rathayibacter sp. VKM Ac-2754]